MVWGQAGFRGTTDGRNQSAFLLCSMTPLRYMGDVPGIRSGNDSYFLQLLKIIFQLTRPPDLVHSMALQRAGGGKMEG